MFFVCSKTCPVVGLFALNVTGLETCFLLPSKWLRYLRKTKLRIRLTACCYSYPPRNIPEFVLGTRSFRGTSSGMDGDSPQRWRRSPGLPMRPVRRYRAQRLQCYETKSPPNGVIPHRSSHIFCCGAPVLCFPPCGLRLAPQHHVLSDIPAIVCVLCSRVELNENVYRSLKFKGVQERAGPRDRIVPHDHPISSVLGQQIVRGLCLI